MSRWSWFFAILSRRLWVRASIYGVLAVVTALVSIYVRRFIPEDVPQKIGADAVDGILHILASSMLAVTIFSVSTMVSAYSTVTTNVTPRATTLLLEDKLSQNALSTFIGAFIFSIVGIVALTTGVYGDTGRLVLFVVTVLVIIAIVVTLLRWIEYLSRLGRVNETIHRVEEATTTAFRERLTNPYLGGTPRPETGSVPDGAIALLPSGVGYIQHIDMSLLSKVAEEQKGQIYIEAMPGTLVHPKQPLAFLQGIPEECFDRALKAFIVDRERSFRQDPRFGMAVLSEIGSRALSRGVNDSGTAVHVISVGLRILLLWTDRASMRKDEILYQSVHVPPLPVSEMLDALTSPMERDGAGIKEVGLALQRAFSALAEAGDPDLRRASEEHSRTAMAHSRRALRLEDDVSAVLAAAPTFH